MFWVCLWMHIYAAVELWGSCLALPNWWFLLDPASITKEANDLKNQFSLFLSAKIAKIFWISWNEYYIIGIQVEQLDSLAAKKILEVCVWMVAKWSKRPQIWTSPDFANCLGQMKISLHWQQYSFKILWNRTRKTFTSCGLNWQHCSTRGWHFNLLLFYGEAESATNISELCCSIHSRFHLWTSRKTWSSDMLESDEIISLHLSKIFCGCKSLLSLEVVCYPCEEYLCNAAVNIDLAIPMILALAHIQPLTKLAQTLKSCSTFFWAGCVGSRPRRREVNAEISTEQGLRSALAFRRFKGPSQNRFRWWSRLEKVAMEKSGWESGVAKR